MKNAFESIASKTVLRTPFLLSTFATVTLQVLYRLKTSKVFEKPKNKSQEVQDDDPFAVEKVAFCAESRLLAVAGSSFYVIVFGFKKQEASVEVEVIPLTPSLHSLI